MGSPSAANIVGSDLAAVLPAQAKPWYRTPHLILLNFYVLILLFSAAGMGFDGSMMNGLQSLTTWLEFFHNPSASLLGVTNAVLNIGPIVFGGVTAWLGDRYGRRRLIQLGCLVIIFSAILQTAAQNLGMFVAARFIIGIGIEFCAIPSPVLITELAYPTHRSKLTALYMTFFFVGAILASWTTYGTYRMNQSTWTWRIPSLMQLVLPSIQFIALFWIPESPRWLVSKGRVAEARALIVKHHCNGDENSPLAEHEMAEIQRYLLGEAEVASTGWSKIWETKADRKRLAVVIYIAFMSQLCGNGLISYYISLVLNTIGITSSLQKTLVNGILTIFSWICAVSGAMLVDRTGRRKLWLFSVTGMLLSYTIWTVLSALYAEHAQKKTGLGVLVMIFFFQFFYSVSITPLSAAYPVEILPFKTRQKVFGLLYVCNSLANLFNSLVSPIALDNIGWRYYIVYVALLLQFLIVIYLCFPETKGYTLEQISDLFEQKALLLGRAKLQRHIEPDGSKVMVAVDKKEDDVLHVEQVENVIVTEKA